MPLIALDYWDLALAATLLAVKLVDSLFLAAGRMRKTPA